MSDFPRPGSYTHPLSDKAIQYLKDSGNTPTSPLVIKREKGAYIIDIDDNKYCDFGLHQGRVVYGHQPGVLSKTIKNGMSTAMGWSHANKFQPRLIKYLHSLIDFDKVFLFNSELGMLLSLLQPVTTSRIGVSSNWLLKELSNISSHLSVEIARKDVHYDALFLEALDFDKDLSPVNTQIYKADIKIAVVTRSFYRTENVFGVGLNEVDAIVVGSSICNGISCGVVLSTNQFDIIGDNLSLGLSLAILETLKFYKRKNVTAYDYPVIKHRQVMTQNKSIIKLKSRMDPQTCLGQGILLNQDIQFLCAEHSEHDIKRLHKTLDQL